MKLYNDQKLDNIWVSEEQSALDVNNLFIFQSSYNSTYVVRKFCIC